MASSLNISASTFSVKSPFHLLYSQRREQLVRAWNLIDPHGNGEISVYDEQLIPLFRILKPQVIYSWYGRIRQHPCGL